MYEENCEAFSNEDYLLENSLANEKSEKSENKLNDRKVGRWTSEEDEILKEMVLKHRGKNWKKVAEKIKGRTSIQCLHRWSKILQPGLVKGPWTIEEDRKLVEWVKKEGATKWSQCAEFISGRNGKQCRERWINSLNPHVKKGDWTPEEDYSLFFYYRKFGGKWSQIQFFFESRSENAIKNRFYSTLRRYSTENKKIAGDEANMCPNKLDDLKKFISLAEDEVKYTFMKKNNLNRDGLNDYEMKLIQNAEEKTSKPGQKVKKDFKNLEKNMNLDGFSEYNNLNEKTKNTTYDNLVTSKKDSDTKTIHNYNISLNFNSNNNNALNFSNANKNLNFDQNQNIFSQDYNNYKSMDIYSLEKDIAGMCDSNLFYNENNFSNYNCFNFDTQIDSLLDSIFTNNNIVINNDPNKECKVCSIEDKKEEAPKEQHNVERSEKSLPLNNVCEATVSEVSAKTKSKKSEKNKEVFQNLLSQLNGLEKLVKNAKKELSKFEHNGEDFSGNSLENLFKYN